KLYEVGPCSQNYLGRLIYLDAATIKGVVDRLHLRGLVTALSDPKDRRRRAVALTDRGRRSTEAAMQVAAGITAATLTPLAVEEQRMVVKLLRKLACHRSRRRHCLKSARRPSPGSKKPTCRATSSEISLRISPTRIWRNTRVGWRRTTTRPTPAR